MQDISKQVTVSHMAAGLYVAVVIMGTVEEVLSSDTVCLHMAALGFFGARLLSNKGSRVVTRLSYWIFASFVFWAVVDYGKRLSEEPTTLLICIAAGLVMTVLYAVYVFRLDSSRIETETKSLNSDERGKLELECMKQLMWYGIIFVAVTVVVDVFILILAIRKGSWSAHIYVAIFRWVLLAGLTYCCQQVISSAKILLGTTASSSAELVSDVPYEGI